MRHLLSLLSIFTLLTSSTLHAQVPSYVPTNGLVGWWPFNGNANDESGNGNNGTVNGATLTQDRFGNSGAAYSFNGINAQISVSSLSILSDWSIGYWFIIPSNSPSFDIQYHVGFNCSSFPNYPGIGCTGTLSNCLPQNSHTFLFDGAGPCNNIQLGNPYVFTNYYHIVLVKSNNQYKFYVNGNQASLSTMLDIDINDLYIGGRCLQGEPRYFFGDLDDIGVWNRALETCEIQALYNAGALGVSPTPVSFSGLNSSYTLADSPSQLVGSPVGGVFIGAGVSGSTFDPVAAGIGDHTIIYSYVDECGSVNSAGFCTEVSVNAGVGGGNMTTGGVRVFPNPSRGQFTVELELNGLVGMQVFDARGALVHNEVFTASGSRTQRTLDLSAFAKGSYTLLVEHGGQRVSQTVVVE